MPIGRSHFITASEYILMQGKTFDRQVICIFKILVINLHFSEILTGGVKTKGPKLR